MKRNLASEEETRRLGMEIASGLSSGDVLGLAGQLGSGKTHFTRGIVAGLESADPVTSPTFTLVNEYPGGRLPVFHFDFYRMESEGEVLRIGWDEYLDEPGIVIVEWADKFPGLMPGGAAWWRFVIEEDGTRTVTRGEAP